MAEVVEVTDDSFQSEVLDAGGLVLVCFWASDDGKGRAMLTTASEIANEYDGRTKVCQIDVLYNPQSTLTAGVDSTPALLLFSSGEVVDKLTTMVPKPVIEKMIQRQM